jgi:hypothetical protein
MAIRPMWPLFCFSALTYLACPREANAASMFVLMADTLLNDRNLDKVKQLSFNSAVQ